MISLIAVLAVSSAFLCPAFPKPSEAPAARAGFELRYDRPLGQVAEYRMVLDVRGEQTSLGERLPVRWRAELEIVEEVIAKGLDGTLWLRVQGRLLKVTDYTGNLAGGMPPNWPAVQVRMTPRGELLDVSAATGEQAAGPRARAFLSLLAQPEFVILPAHRVEPGDRWQADAGGARQVNQLVSLSETATGTIACISSSKSTDLAVREASPALGLETDLTGRSTDESELQLLVEKGLALSHSGEMDLRSKSTASLDLGGTTQVFDISANLRVAFEVQLLAVDGRPIVTD